MNFEVDTSDLFLSGKNIIHFLWVKHTCNGCSILITLPFTYTNKKFSLGHRHSVILITLPFTYTNKKFSLGHRHSVYWFIFLPIEKRPQSNINQLFRPLLEWGLVSLSKFVGFAVLSVGWSAGYFSEVCVCISHSWVAGLSLNLMTSSRGLTSMSSCIFIEFGWLPLSDPLLYLPRFENNFFFSTFSFQTTRIPTPLLKVLWVIRIGSDWCLNIFTFSVLSIQGAQKRTDLCIYRLFLVVFLFFDLSECGNSGWNLQDS